MTFLITLAIVTTATAVLFGILAAENYSTGDAIVSFLSGIVAITALFLIPALSYDAKINKALMQSYLESPTNYTYEQLAEHNKFVSKAKVYQGTIFSFYNDVDLQTIDIDNVSQKVIVK